MSNAVCVAFSLPLLPASVSLDHANGHLEAARASLGDDLVAEVALTEPEREGAGALVASKRRHSLEALLEQSPLLDSCWHAVGGVTADTFQPATSTEAAPNAYLTVVADQNEPPIPFDDPAVVGVFRDQFAWYLPLLGDRYAACGAIFFDGVRACGSYMLFTSESLEIARYLSMLDPWRRLGGGWLFTLPRGVFVEHAAPAGPGTQRSGSPVCAGIDSTGEPTLRKRGGA